MAKWDIGYEDRRRAWTDKDWDMAHDAALADGYDEVIELCGLQYIEYWVGKQRVTKLKSVFELEQTLKQYGLPSTQREVILHLVDNVIQDKIDEYQID